MYKFICRIISLKGNCLVNGYCQILYYRNFLHASVYSHQQCMSSYFKYLIKLTDFCLSVRYPQKRYLSLVFSCNNFIVTVSIILRWKPFVFFSYKSCLFMLFAHISVVLIFFLSCKIKLINLSEIPFLLHDYLKKKISSKSFRNFVFF